MTERREGLAFRNPVKQEGWAMIYHVLTLDQNLSDGAFRLYVLLLKYARQSENCWPGRRRLAQDLDTTKRTVERRLAELVDRGLITREQRGLGRTAMTWIEDVEAVYAADSLSPDRFVEASPDKNDEALAPTDLSRKEETEEEADMKGDGGPATRQQHSLSLLTAFGVTQTVAEELARRCSLEDIEGWIDYTKRANGLHSPVAFVVSKLKAGEPAPVQQDKEDDHAVISKSWIEAGAQH